jgi:hypothetical protein
MNSALSKRMTLSTLAQSPAAAPVTQQVADAPDWSKNAHPAGDPNAPGVERRLPGR